MSRSFAERNCAINEQTGDGTTVGRCWFYVGDNDVCPRHGDVKKVMERYRSTGKLTLENDHRLEEKSEGPKKSSP